MTAETAMTPLTATTAEPPHAPALLLEEAFGWCRAERGAATVWLKGYLARGSADTLAAEFAGWLTLDDPDALRKRLLALDGHFALVIALGEQVLAAVDRVRSIPIAYARAAQSWVVGSAAADVRERVGIGAADVDPAGALAIAMAGYTVGRDTLHKSLQQLGPGEAALFTSTLGPVQRLQYHAWRPWMLEPGDPVRLEHHLREITLAILEKQISTLNGRTIALPLSAGYDSRLIASGLHHLGFKDVLCFSYGQCGGHEAETARQVAERLGFPWRFMATGPRRQARYFKSEYWAGYRDFSDDDTAIPFVQDMAAILDLREVGYLPDDCVFMNGNSGDFISGFHIALPLRSPASGLDSDGRRLRIVETLASKHFALWRHLSSRRNVDAIATRLWTAIEAAGGALGAPDADHGLYERSEFHDRQSKYVIKGQRTYEFLGHDWRLPLWDADYLDFWQGVPLTEKAGQALYTRMLHNANWGGVWADLPLNRRHIRPRWIIPLRWAAKAAHAPLGRARWHRFERQVFGYWMDGLGTSAIVPYGRVLNDRRGARNAMAWLAEGYLASHGVAIDAFAAS